MFEKNKNKKQKVAKREKIACILNFSGSSFYVTRIHTHTHKKKKKKKREREREKFFISFFFFIFILFLSKILTRINFNQTLCNYYLLIFKKFKNSKQHKISPTFFQNSTKQEGGGELRYGLNIFTDNVSWGMWEARKKEKYTFFLLLFLISTY